MAVFRVNATRTGELMCGGETPGPGGAAGWEPSLERLADVLPSGAPVCVLIHGFRYSWRAARGRGATPHSFLYACAAEKGPCRRPPPAWPVQLGFSEDGVEDGLCIAFGWEARIEPGGHRSFADVHAAAVPAGQALARLLAALSALRPELHIDMLTHSLGARVAMQAGLAHPGLPLRRLVLLGAAEHRGQARAFLATLGAMGSAAAVYHVMSRANDLFDGLFGLIAPAPAEPGDVPLGLAGLGHAHPHWLDLQLDGEPLRAWLLERGMPLCARTPRLSHWHFYTEPGVMALYRAILRGAPGWSIAELRAAGLPQGLAPRWSRLLPLPRPASQGTVPEAPALTQI